MFYKEPILCNCQSVGGNKLTGSRAIIQFWYPWPEGIRYHWTCKCRQCCCTTCECPLCRCMWRWRRRSWRPQGRELVAEATLDSSAQSAGSNTDRFFNIQYIFVSILYQNKLFTFVEIFIKNTLYDFSTHFLVLVPSTMQLYWVVYQLTMYVKYGL